MGCAKGEEMTQDIPSYLTMYFYPNMTDKTHRDSCTSCQFAIAGMILFVDIIREQEKKTYDE